MRSLKDFQNAFAAALRGDADALRPWLETPADPGPQVYRNTVFKGLVDAIVDAYPTVARLVGEPWLRAAAREFAAAHLPDRASLSLYGRDFPDWLAAFEPARSLPYLPGVARLDRLWLECHLAADAEPLSAQALQALEPSELERVTLEPHPSARAVWFDDNVVTIWLANRPPAEPPEALVHTNEPGGLLISRADGLVRTRRLDLAEFAFVAACASGRSLAFAAEGALQMLSRDELALLVSELIGLEAFCGPIALAPSTSRRPLQ
jgi:hypothetical protein